MKTSESPSRIFLLNPISPGTQVTSPSLTTIPLPHFGQYTLAIVSLAEGASTAKACRRASGRVQPVAPRQVLAKLSGWSGYHPRRCGPKRLVGYAGLVDKALAFRIRGLNREHVIVHPTGRERPEASDYWDGNWVYATVTVAARAFRGEFEAQLRAEEFVRFRDQLQVLYETLKGGAKFETMEGWLTVDIQGDGKGHFRAACIAVDQPGIGNRLAFALDFDQTELPEILRGVDAICAAFPVVGKR